MRKRHKARITSSRKSNKGSWLVRYRVHILSLLGLFALFFGVLSYYQQSNSVLGLATAGRFDIGGGLSGASKSVSTSCKSVKTYCDKKYGGITKYSQCTQTVKYSNKPKPTINPLRDYTTATYIKGCKSSYEIKLSPTPTPGITLSATNLYCGDDTTHTYAKDNNGNIIKDRNGIPVVDHTENNNNLIMDLTITTNYKSTGDDFSCRNCFFQSGEEKMLNPKTNSEWEELINDLHSAELVWNEGAPGSINPFTEYKDTISKIGEDHPITEVFQDGGKITGLGPNKIFIPGFTYKNVWAGAEGSSADDMIEYFLSLPAVNNTNATLHMENGGMGNGTIRALRVYTITIIDTTKSFNSKHPYGSLAINNKCVNGKLENGVSR